LTGEQALYRLLSMGNGEFRLQPFKNPPVRTIEGSWEYLLMEAARASDEAKGVMAGEDTVLIKRDSATTKSPTVAGPTDSATVPAKPSGKAEEPGYKDLGEDIVIVSTYDGNWRPVDGSKR